MLTALLSIHELTGIRNWLVPDSQGTEYSNTLPSTQGAKYTCALIQAVITTLIVLNFLITALILDMGNLRCVPILLPLPYF